MGVAIGIVLTELIQEEAKELASGKSGQRKEESVKRNGLFAEVCGSTVKMYEVKDGHFCGYTDTKEFESQEAAMEWVVKETDAKMVLKAEN